MGGKANLSDINSYPLPSIIIDDTLNILDSSKEATTLFGKADNILSWIDQESQAKAKKFIIDRTQRKIELNMNVIGNTTSLFILYLKWSADKCTIIFMQQDAMLMDLMRKVNDHKRRLEESDMKLILRNNQLTASHSRIQELSVAVIHLSPTIVLIPIFGDLNETLITQNMERILTHISTNQIDEVIIDFQSVGLIEEIGMYHIKQLIESFTLIGAKTYVTGVKPEHAPLLNQHKMLQHATFINTLNHTISKLV